VNCFVDTSAFYAVLDADDRNHPAARDQWATLLGNAEGLITTSYVLVETSALIQRRLGLPAVRTFQEDIYPLLRVEWLGREIHEAGIAAVLSAQRRELSLVDCVSFDVMHRYALRRAFAFDPHFAEQGFECVPSPFVD
jgi:predicted nucleic acid-binding protein